MAEQDSKTRLRTRRQVTMNIWKQQTTPPTYKEMICLALCDLKQNKGSPRHVILNYICDNFNIKRRTIASRRLNSALKTGVSDGTFRKSKGTKTIPDKYLIGDMKGLGTHKITTKLPKKALCVKTKTAKVTKSEPIQNKKRIRSKQRERSDQNMRLVNSQMTLKRNIPKERQVSKQVSCSESQVKSTYKGSKHRKVSQLGTLSKCQVTPRRKRPKQRKVDQQGTLSKSQVTPKMKSPKQRKVDQQRTFSKCQVTPRRKNPKQRKVNQQGTLSTSQLISKRKSPRQGKVSKQWTLSKSHVTIKRKSPKHENIPQQGAHTNSGVKQKSTQFEEEVESQNTCTSNTTEETVDIRNEDHDLMNIRVVKQDPISIHTQGDLNTEHLFVYSLTTTPSGRILVVDVHRGYTYVNMLDIEGHHLSQ